MPKKEKYNLLDQKGERVKILLCLLKGNENASSITRRLSGKVRKLPWVSNYVQELKKNDYIDEYKIPYKDQKNREMTKPVFRLNHKFFVAQCNYKFKMKFTLQEISWIKRKFESFDRDNMVSYCSIEFENRIFDTFVYFIMKEISKLKFDKIIGKLAIKFYVISHELKYDLALSKEISIITYKLYSFIDTTKLVNYQYKFQEENGLFKKYTAKDKKFFDTLKKEVLYEKN